MDPETVKEETRAESPPLRSDRFDDFGIGDIRRIREEISSKIRSTDPLFRQKLSDRVGYSQAFTYLVREEEEEEPSPPLLDRGSPRSQSGEKTPSSSTGTEQGTPSSSYMAVPSLVEGHSTNVCRSASFNERMLKSPNSDILSEARCNSAENFYEKRSKGSFTSQDTSSTKSLSDTRSTASQDTQASRRSIKNMATTFARRISFKKQREWKSLATPAQEPEPVLVNGPPPSTTSSLVCYEALLQLFQCPGCQMQMSPPLPQCRKGHLICDKCKVTSKATCPICKQRVADTTNYMMEQVYKITRFRCKFGNYGCPEFYLPSQKADHQQFCHYRPVHCHFETLGCDKFLSFKDMKVHLQECEFKTASTTPNRPAALP